ncbi:DeoR/GlpR family DNA-binding transcription regulator [Bacillus sp. 03113]|uniref:DeoR/GlpR family DNA-binding transcription regulator n=1 Tax=Bacillus sp. 03113 TaxID=2578211 RepID=UPI0011444B24|nr:DeoR/GlpR family DNA-binding transcription regulator [Bacillus sp. 03113]
MLTPERHRIILQLLKEKSIVEIHEMVELTNTSESTIRRDLTLLEQGKYLKRIHGGAIRLQGKLNEPTMDQKSTIHLNEKRLIAQYAASLVEEGDSIYLDAGSTIREMIPFLPTNQMVVVTNGMMHIHALLEKGIMTFILGGCVKQKTNAVIGCGAQGSIEKYRFDKCFIGVNGIHPEFGYTTPDQEEAAIKHSAISLSREAFVLSDESKFSEISFAKIADLHDAMIITNHLPKERRNLYSSKTNIKVVST